jgi:hypothetical protein
MATQEQACPTAGAVRGSMVLVVNRAVTHPLPRRKLFEVVSLLRAEWPGLEVVETRDVAEFGDIGPGSARAA